ncbi:hypothetical protein SMSP2_01811 [Limihaloglobus sulfuriphilus]|uniref:Uncharacterized protein n=1 Tax=Limihaloglobus sulfuriphilus TaxID=1851148 RepID=A0A1Q2MGK0_9BACT|nr:hypothetical protein [Limihaloglobus sulfuriphilus]AQQ71437.1 hypothetical protein SMSP2_01811 [Limihaloglobus sulfuriphilus]
MAKQKSSSSVKMVKLKKWDEIAKLGEEIVKTLSINPNNSLLQIWMSHYIAELIEKEKTAKSKRSRNQIRKECSDLITRLWMIRYKYDPNDPIYSLEQNLKILVGKNPLKKALVNASIEPNNIDENMQSEGGGFEHLIASIIKLSEKEKEIIMAALTADVSEEEVLSYSSDNMQDKNEFTLNIKTLINYRDRILNSDNMLKGIIQAESDVERMDKMIKALSKTNKQRQDIIKKMKTYS